jgi:hypothetical protein
MEMKKNLSSALTSISNKKFMSTETLCPFVEYNLSHKYLSHHFATLIETEIFIQKRQVKLGQRKHVQIDLNELYGWNNLANKKYGLLRRVVLNDAVVNPILEQDILTGNVKDLFHLARQELKHQRKAIRRGERRGFSVNFNALYC